MIITNLSRRDLWRYVNIKVNRTIHYYHVRAVLNIFFQELIKDLKKEKTITVHNFFKLKLQKTKPRPYHDVNLDKTMMSSGSKILKFNLFPVIRNKICFLLDFDKTFPVEKK